MLKPVVSMITAPAAGRKGGTLRSLSRASRGEKDLELRLGKHHSAHVSPVRHQPGRLAKGALPLEQGLAYPWQRRNYRGVAATFFGAYRIGHVLSFQHDTAFDTTVHRLKLHIKISNQRFEYLLIF